MADQYINPTGLQIIKDWIRSEFTNKIEKIKANDIVLTPDAQKAVRIPIPTVESKEGIDAIKITGLDGTLEYYGEIEFGSTPNGLNVKKVYNSGGYDNVELASKTYVDDNGGKIDKIKLNGTEQSISNKEVDLTVPVVNFTPGDDKVDISQNNNSVTFKQNGENVDYDYNSTFLATLISKTYADTTFRTEAQVQQAIDDSLADVTNWKFSEPMLTLPATGELGTIYLVARGNVLEPPYDEWFWLVPKTGDPHFEKFGDTTIDLSAYWSKTELQAMTVAEINAILDA